MTISELIAQLQVVIVAEGNIEVTCTGSALPDGYPGGALPDIFETTVETLKIGDHPTIGRSVRLYM